MVQSCAAAPIAGLQEDFAMPIILHPIPREGSASKRGDAFGWELLLPPPLALPATQPGDAPLPIGARMQKASGTSTT